MTGALFGWKPRTTLKWQRPGWKFCVRELLAAISFSITRASRLLQSFPVEEGGDGCVLQNFAVKQQALQEGDMAFTAFTRWLKRPRTPIVPHHEHDCVLPEVKSRKRS